MTNLLKSKHAALLLLGAMMASGCEDSRMQGAKKNEVTADCKFQFCNVEFRALSFAGSGPIVVRISEQRFFRIDGHTSEDIVNKFGFLQSGEDLNYTAYGGKLDADLVWSQPVESNVILIHRLNEIHVLPPSEAVELRESLSAPKRSD